MFIDKSLTFSILSYISFCLISLRTYLFARKFFSKANLTKYLPWSTVYLDSMYYNLRIFQICTVCQIIFNISSFNSFSKNVFWHTQGGYIVKYAGSSMFLMIATGVHRKGMRKCGIKAKFMIASYNYFMFVW